MTTIPFANEIATNLNSRQWKIIPKEISELRFLIIGLGAVGSNIANLLCATNARHLTVIDFDDVGIENIYPQFYTYDQIGMNKAEALKQTLEATYAGIPQIEARNERYGGYDAEEFDVVICCPDTNRDRRRIYTRGKMTYDFWLDARFGEEDGLIFALPSNAADIEDRRANYVEFALQEGYEDPVDCGVRSTSYLTKGLVPGIMVVRILQWIRGEEVPYSTQIFGHIGQVFAADAPTKELSE